MYKILLAEDEPVIRMLITDTLEDEGYDIDIATDGAEAMTYIEKNQYDLLILDYMMPRMTGMEVIGKVREMPENQQLKILMLSAKNQHSERERVMQIGANEFMSKPFSPMELIRRVREMLSGASV